MSYRFVNYASMKLEKKKKILLGYNPSTSALEPPGVHRNVGRRWMALKAGVIIPTGNV